MTAEGVTLADEPVQLSSMLADYGSSMAQLCVAVLLGWVTLVMLTVIARRSPAGLRRLRTQVAGPAKARSRDDHHSRNIHS